MDESALQRISEIGTHLAQRSRPNKDFILKSLKEAASILSQLEQLPSLDTTHKSESDKTKSREATKKEGAAKKRESAIKPLASAVIHGLLKHADKDVRLLVAICITEIFRVMAPDPPFEDKELMDIFKLIISIFADLADTTSPFFPKRVKILDTLARCKCGVIMLDIECHSLVLEMFNILFSVVRDDHHASVVDAMSSIMIQILNEEASQQLLEVLLRNLIKGGKDQTSAASELAAAVIKTCADKLMFLVCRFLNSCISNRYASGCELKESYDKIIFKIFQCDAEVLHAVISPYLIEDLLADQVDVRKNAVSLVGKLFALPEHLVAQKYHDLFVEFLKRFSDKSVDVRISALQCAQAFYSANHRGSESHEIIAAVEERLLDFDDRVRLQAVLVACDLCKSNLKLVPSKLISQATERLRDKKISVRKKAMQKLIELYQDYCKKCCEGSMWIRDHFEEIPCKIVRLCYDKDCKEFRWQNMEFVLADNLFPDHLSVEERTKHWIHIFSLFSSLHEKALNTVLTQKRRFQNEMKSYLAFRKKLKEISSEEIQKTTESIFMRMAASFTDPPKAEEYLHKLNHIKDNNVFNSLEELLERQTFATGRTIQDKLVKMVGDSHPCLEFLSTLFSKCSYNIFSVENVQFILDYLSNNANGNKHLEDSCMKLLLVIVRNFPSILKGSEQQLLMLLEQRTPADDKLIEVLAKAGSHISVKLSDIYPFLERMCLEGTRSQAKFAVSAIAALSSEQSVFSNLYEELVDSLYSQWNVPTVLQSLGCLAQYSVSTFETRDDEIASYICQKIIQVECFYDVHEATSSDDNSGCSPSCQLKIYALKTLVKSFLPCRGNHVRRKIDGLLNILLQMLQESDTSVRKDSCDEAHIRLAAAKSILRLSTRWDLHISPEIFRSTVSVAKDSSSFVRRSFLNKTQKMLKERRLPIRYACAFPLAETDSIEDLQFHKIKYMADFIKDFSREARMRQTSAVQGAVVGFPAYIVVFLIHVLAHDDGFPSEGFQDEEVYADLCSPLFFVLQSLVNANIVDGDLDLVNDAVLYLFSILRAIKKAEDAIDVQMTTRLHLLADIGIFILNALNHGAISVSQAPRQILLPSSLYRISLAKNDANSKCMIDECFLSRVFQKLKSNDPQACVQKPAKTFPGRGRKCQDVANNINICSLKESASSKLDALSRRATTEAKVQRPNIASGQRRKRALSPTVSGSLGLHECSTIDKQQNLLSNHCESTLERNELSSCDSVSLKGSLAESHSPTHKQKRDATSLTKNAVTSRKSTVRPPKCPKTKLRDSCDSKKEDILADISNKRSFLSCDPGEHSSLCSPKKTATTGDPLPSKERTSLNQENASENKRRKSSETSASEVVNVKEYAVTGSRTRRKL